METLYFIGFCLFVAYLIFWALVNDDFADFMGQQRDGKFRLPKKGDVKEK